MLCQIVEPCYTPSIPPLQIKMAVTMFSKNHPLRKCLEDCLQNLILYLPSLFVGPTYLSISIFSFQSRPHHPRLTLPTYTATPQPGYHHHHSTTRHARGGTSTSPASPVPPPFAAGRPLRFPRRLAPLSSPQPLARGAPGVGS
jgi:hypothetical protein